MIDLLATFIVFFSVIDPVGSVPVFLAVTKKYDNKIKKKIALIAFLVSTGILVFFIIAGEFILTAMSIPLAAFQVGGGIVLFLFALSMIFGESKPEEEIRIAKKHQDTAVYPLSVPSIAGPGAMLTAVLMTENAKFNIWEQAQTGLVMVVVLLITYIFMILSNHINKLIGEAGASVISRVMGLILTSVGVTNTLNGLKAFWA